ncbi:hypothetical protein PR048_033528 [Dryococelus australis]|uniref:Uncharacterized protein n=1 Tax=Dryococelus australis TaxID=614101 RepID=A0ABQ9G0I7_9NEOP|nr:hypothetical protein PR048_033528 [Dryococelus australis]
MSSWSTFQPSIIDFYLASSIIQLSYIKALSLKLTSPKNPELQRNWIWPCTHLQITFLLQQTRPFHAIVHADLAHVFLIHSPPLVRQCDHAHSHWQRTRQPADLEYNHSRRHTAKKIQSCSFTDIAAWQFIRKFRGTPRLIPHLLHAGTTLESPTDKVTALATHFAVTFHSSIPPPGLIGHELSSLTFETTSIPPPDGKFLTSSL